VATEVKTMEVKKTQQLASGASSKEASASKKKARDFVGEIKSELMKISWTSPEELKTYTKIVVGATFFCGIGLYIMDLVIQTTLSVLESALRIIIG
jgi:preprotein translocase subunit SecE